MIIGSEENDMRKRIIATILIGIFIQLIYSILNAQTDPFDKVEGILRQHGKGVYRDRNSLNKNIIKQEREKHGAIYKDRRCDLHRPE